MERDDQFSILTRVGPGTPMGNLFRRFWLPALLAGELPEPDGVPVRLRILGEDLVAFRDSEGRIGIVDAYCPHKLAPLFFGRNEACGLRCVYHGWKFNVDGACVDIPNVVPPDNFEALKARMRLKSYPSREAGGLVWVYMGPAERMPELPGMEWLGLPDEQLHVSRWLHRSNWLQAAEGEIDTSHISFLHSVPKPDEAKLDVWRLARDGAPHIGLRETDYGFLYGARRRYGEQYYWRVTQWMLPMWSAIPTSRDDLFGNGRAWVPIDDYTTTAFAYRYRPDKPLSKAEVEFLDSGAFFPPRNERRAVRLPHGYSIDTFVPLANQDNDYLIDRQAQRHDSFTGIWGVNEQDRALQECAPSLPGQPPGIADRSGEHLVKSDLPVITARRLLTRLVRQLEQGQEPEAALRSEQYAVRAFAEISPIADFDTFMQQYGHLTRPGEAEKTRKTHERKAG
jgi:phenylpropionate dioxygenase-like ring-hydroxylating dioxygenase large terminal subunit